MKRTLLVIALAALLTVGCNAQNESQNEVKVVERPVQQPLPSLVTQTDFTEVAARTIDAVVHIKTEMTKLTPLYQSFFGMIIDRGVRRQTYNAFGSGVIISSDGYIVTNNHVVQDAEKLTVTLNDKRELPARIVGIDPATDLAVIKIQADNLQFIPFGNSDSARIGEPVLAIGNPFNLTSTVTAGIISAKARYMNIINNPGVESTIESFIQTDAAVNSGNSGGALVNGRAELIGINTAIASGNGYYTGYSFAIPSNIARKVAGDLRRYGAVQRGYLGINVVEVTNELAAKLNLEQPKGIYIARVIPKCAADKAGLREGDILLKVNNMDVNSYASMMEEVALFNPGDNVEVQYQRNGELHTATLMLLNSQGNTQIIKS
ncbi:MAG: trypsin-like peptidase domain-containing protein [Bacteroidales bacterium]|nr:trypsin-like peptidase domain-containing protein [Bacteroidales bacterium]MBR6331154.1 trypsin-like peptidase domain-containing protein [Bacteroidales bacterium]